MKFRILTEPVKPQTIGGDLFRLYRRMNANRYGRHVISFFVRLGFLSAAILCFSGAAWLGQSAILEGGEIKDVMSIIFAAILIFAGVYLCIKPLTYK